MKGEPDHFSDVRFSIPFCDEVSNLCERRFDSFTDVAGNPAHEFAPIEGLGTHDT